MSRLIKIDDKTPIEIKPSDKSVWVCRCGLSKSKPYCDGSHNKTSDEPENICCYYNPEGIPIKRAIVDEVELINEKD